MDDESKEASLPPPPPEAAAEAAASAEAVAEAPDEAPSEAVPPAAASPGPLDTRKVELLEALAAKQISKVCRIVERLKFDVDTVLNDEGETAVHVCVHHCGTRRDPGYVPVLRCLLRLGASPDTARRGGQMPAHRCAAFDLTPMLALLGEFGANVDEEDDEGYAPVHICAAWGKASALEWLLTRGGVHVERVHANGMTLSMFAAAAGHLETLKCLRRLGADFRRPCFIEHDLIKGQRVQAMIMSMACYEGRDDVVAWLVDECDIQKCESEIVVVEPEYIDYMLKKEKDEERVAKEALLASRARDALKKNPYGRPYGPFGYPRELPVAATSSARPASAVDIEVVAGDPPKPPNPDAAALLDAFAPADDPGDAARGGDDVDITVDDLTPALAAL